MKRMYAVWSCCVMLSFPALAEMRNGPPSEALAACHGKHDNSACSFATPRGNMSGSCRTVRNGALACVPDDRAGNNMQRPAQNDAGTSRSSGSRFNANIAGENPAAIAVRSRVPDTHQGSCFDDAGIVPCPSRGAAYWGQDAQFIGAAPAYRDNGDGTVSDRVTGLVWQQAHNAERLNQVDAAKACSALRLGGHRDWRLPNIKELFSLADFRGSQGKRNYLNEVFEFSLPDSSVLQGDPFSEHNVGMMGQTWSSTIYTGDHWGRRGVKAAFFFNFLDGHIKQAPVQSRNTLFYRCVRGAEWGGNDFVVKGDVVLDRATGLNWQRADDGRTRNWQQALSYCAALKLDGHSDWRLPNIKELQSIVDYGRHAPALDERYLKMSDAKGWFWSSTTHGDNIRMADYICFGACTSVQGVDVHGAGAQRSDPKQGRPSDYPSLGPQQDEVRIDNYVRCVR
ncbi:MAG: DUF1566 domain-containing protein [Pseudomonadota bacterium]